jgi:hypothetical protein
VSDEGGAFINWRQKVFSALVLLLLVALGARIAAELLAPLAPVLVSVVLLCFIGWAVFGHRM